jgi:hypothetical protein
MSSSKRLSSVFWNTSSGKATSSMVNRMIRQHYGDAPRRFPPCESKFPEPEA